MNERNILLTARVVSLLFTPYYLPIVGLIALFVFSYLSVLPLGYQLTMLLIVYLSIVLAGGVGSRLGLSTPKQFFKVAGKMVIEHTLDTFEHNAARAMK